MKRPYNGAIRAFKFLGHQLFGGNSHSIHSPFVFELYTELKKNEFPAETAEIRRLHTILKKDRTKIQFLDPGKGMELRVQKIGTIARHSAKGKRAGLILQNLTRYLKPSQALELGTSLGISALYQSAGYPSMLFTTIEGVPEIARLAQQNLKHRAPQITVINDLFDASLSSFIREELRFDYVYLDGHHQEKATLDYWLQIKQILNEGACVVFDDIHWSSGMERAWRTIITDKAVPLTIDIFHFGIVIFRSGVPKQHFVLRA